jgi:hypothetical protein
MAEPAKVKEGASALASELVEALSPNIVAQLAMELIQRVPELPMPPLEAAFNTDDDGDEAELAFLECPHCFTELTYDGVIMVDIDVRDTSAHDVAEDGDGEGTLYFDTDSGMDHRDFHLKCSSCGLFVGKPPGWDVEWS